MSATECAPLLKYSTTGGASVLRCVMSNRWPLILPWSGWFVSSLRIGPANYNEQHLNKQLHSVLNLSRKSCLQLKQNQEKPARVPLVVTYHPILPSFHTTTKQHLPILQASERQWEAFRYSQLIAFRRPRNLKNFLVQSTLTSTPSKSPGNYPCGAPRCKNLSYIEGHKWVFQPYYITTAGERQRYTKNYLDISFSEISRKKNVPTTHAFLLARSLNAWVRG